MLTCTWLRPTTTASGLWSSSVGVGSGRGGAFRIQYPVPDAEAPWPGAVMLLGAHDVGQACEMVAYGLSKARGIAYSYQRHAEPHATDGGA
jgi:hypothetical protein